MGQLELLNSEVENEEPGFLEILSSSNEDDDHLATLRDEAVPVDLIVSGKCFTISNKPVVTSVSFEEPQYINSPFGHTRSQSRTRWQIRWVG